ncbi:hypothetical protein [Curtobacterium sp. MCBD17_008]|uniref:hypothetical protein n=1 Tax=Curtobacterium sp. MCBD17_008 TaxID=2175656 RepID=UPI000DAAC87F|nr:hypothetical protein [Curtobacterium sp. MCBD17_008]PZE88886.1 hypothetical protein DEI95_14790 [Curtobacterium sp. MCBD17_008]
MDVDWIGALIGAVAGAVLTASAAYVVYRYERRQVEEASIRELMLNLSERRAFRIEHPAVVPGAADLQDFHRLSRSVISARESIRMTRSALVRHGQAQRSLTRMIQECNLYLERSDAEPERYWFLAADLRDTLHELLADTGLKSAQNAPRPGDDAFPR